jgi:hypothetical protein
MPGRCARMEDQGVQRIWRLRKLNHAVDAELRQAPAGTVCVRFLYDGVLTYERHWPTRALALVEAADKRAELERSGWMSHW